MKVKSRFAPSPTGFLHVGSARTALFNWLFARHHQGEFVLRIEDTDQERSKQEFEDEIIESLKWLGLNWDGGLEHQSKRKDVYQRFADQLLKKDMAYAEGQALRFRSPRETISWDDMIRGNIEFDGNLFDDLVLMKSDGSPAYNFACVCDDGDMGITHVIRGEDHISNTPKQIPVYKALGLTPPIFAHIPLILGEDRSRLSKRHGATSIRDYRNEGYLSTAMVNYLCLLGWSPGNNQEIIGLEESIQKFDLKKVLSTGAIFDRKKLDWMNGEYIRSFPSDKLKNMFLESLKESGISIEEKDDAWINRFTELYRKRVFVMRDLPSESKFFFEEEVEWTEEGEAVLRKNDQMNQILSKYSDCLNALGSFDHEAVEVASRDFMKSMGLSGKQFIHPARVAITGRVVSPGFFEVVSLLGKTKAVNRLKKASEKLKN